MKFTVGIAMSPLDQLTAWHRPQRKWFREHRAARLPVSSWRRPPRIPYTPDGSRMWNAETTWVDTLIAAAAMGAVTSTIGFYTNVLKLGSRTTPCCWRGRRVR